MRSFRGEHSRTCLAEHFERQLCALGGPNVRLLLLGIAAVLQLELLLVRRRASLLEHTESHMPSSTNVHACSIHNGRRSLMLMALG